eukprot:Tbor_TRINITY_DN712_c0_g1::TRINITY_DN712_c0_g1_i1::g.3323::m.3323
MGIMSCFSHYVLYSICCHSKFVIALIGILSVIACADEIVPNEKEPSHHKSHKASDSKGKSFAVFGYLPEYRLGGFNYEAAFQTGLTHLIYFSLEIDGNEMIPSALDRLPSKDQARQARAAADKVGGKIILGFGGNGRSRGFPKVVSTARARQNFLQALNNLLLEYEFDGVDYNWEYPRNEGEWLNWGKLMSESKRYLLGGLNVVTFTMYQDPKHAQVIRETTLLNDADYVHCMSYDYVPGKHSTYRFAEKGVTMALTQMAPRNSNISVISAAAKKFTLGLPFYGRDVHNGTPQTYADISKMIMSSSVNQVGDMYFNSVSLIRKKTRLAKERGLGGVMIWELGQDIQPMSLSNSLMWGVMEAVSGKAQREILEERRTEGGSSIRKASTADEDDL